MNFNYIQELTNKIKNEINIIDVINLLGIEHNNKICRCFNINKHKNKDSHYSLSIDTNKNLFYCFSCGIKGDIIELYKLYYNTDYINAVLSLSKAFNLNSNVINTISKQIKSNNKYNKFFNNNINENEFLNYYDFEMFDERAGIMEFEGNLKKEIAEKEALKIILNLRKETNVKILNDLINFVLDENNKSEVLEYLYNYRKINIDVIENNNLCITNKSKELYKFLLNKFSIQDLAGAGLINAKGNFIINDYYRLIIPYFKNNKVEYLRVRYYDKNKNDKPKLNFPKYLGLRNDILNLNTVKRFYNFDILEKLKLYDELYIFEGEIDTLSGLTLGLNSIGILGINAIPEIKEIINTLNYKIVLCFDSDTAGAVGINKWINLYNDFNKSVSFIDLPKNFKDVSEFLMSNE